MKIIWIFLILNYKTIKKLELLIFASIKTIIYLEIKFLLYNKI